AYCVQRGIEDIPAKTPMTVRMQSDQDLRLMTPSNAYTSLYRIACREKKHSGLRFAKLLITVQCI
ncbi:MAG: hypothetical protein M3Z36_08570, partial [Acidobacteriota bacterium]|nr:hypothetical protein [Acidobacteriota bacterium]